VRAVAILFLRILEQTRQKYRFVVLGYVVMPEHFHLLISEPQVGNPSVVMQVVKQRYAQRLLRRRKSAIQPGLFDGRPVHIWQARFYDFNVWTERKRVEKLNYMHGNPVKRRLVLKPEQWQWSSFRWYLRGEVGIVRLNDDSVINIEDRPSSSTAAAGTRPSQKARGAGHPRVLANELTSVARDGPPATPIVYGVRIWRREWRAHPAVPFMSCL
jgi:putative transposase